LPLAGAIAAGAAAGLDADPTVHAAPASPAPVVLRADDLDLDPPAWVNQAEPVVDPGERPGAGAALAAGPLGWIGEVGPPDEVDEAGPELVDPGPPTAPIDLRDLPPSGAEVAAGPDEPADRVDEADGPSADGPSADGPEPPIPAGDPVHDEGDGDGAGVGVDEHATDEVAVVGAPAGAAVAADEPDERRRRRWPWILLIVLLLAGAGGAAAAVATRDRTPEAPPIDLPLPDVVGRPEAEARSILTGGGWKVTVVRERRNDTTKGEVIDSRPTAGTRLPEGRTVTLTVSDGQEIVDVPTDLAGASLEDATAALAAVGLEASTADTPYDEEAPEGTVIRVAEGTPTRLERGSTVALVVSKGPEPRTIPSGLVGSTEDAAVEALEALGLKAAIVRSYSDSVDEGRVISVLPRAGSTVPRGETVNVEVSRGPELVSVPSISGADSIAEAVSIITGAGLKAGSVSGPAAGTPVGTSPGAGTLVRPGSTVNIVLG
ncbi:MAG: PASTA domain-containing protein, partial [Acidimicrobiales bacterium]